MRSGAEYETHLTVPDPDLQARIEATPRGMMHWSGTGPDGAVCFGCEHYSQRKLVTKAEREQPATVPGACEKWARWMNANTVDGWEVRCVFPPDTAACSHFIERTACRD